MVENDEIYAGQYFFLLTSNMLEIFGQVFLLEHRFSWWNIPLKFFLDYCLVGASMSRHAILLKHACYIGLMLILRTPGPLLLFLFVYPGLVAPSEVLDIGWHANADVFNTFEICS